MGNSFWNPWNNENFKAKQVGIWVLSMEKSAIKHTSKVFVKVVHLECVAITLFVEFYVISLVRTFHTGRFRVL